MTAALNMMPRNSLAELEPIARDAVLAFLASLAEAGTRPEDHHATL